MTWQAAKPGWRSPAKGGGALLASPVTVKTAAVTEWPLMPRRSMTKRPLRKRAAQIAAALIASMVLPVPGGLQIRTTEPG